MPMPTAALSWCDSRPAAHLLPHEVPQVALMADFQPLRRDLGVGHEAWEEGGVGVLQVSIQLRPAAAACGCCLRLLQRLPPVAAA